MNLLASFRLQIILIGYFSLAVVIFLLVRSDCTCEVEPACTCTMADMVEMAMKLMKQQEKILKEGDSVSEALTMRVSVSCTTVLIFNFSV